MVKVLFFAQLREQLGCEKILVEAHTAITVSQLRELIVSQHPEWSIFLNNHKLLFAVNQTLVKATHTIANGDEVAFFPPVTGG